jgi:HEAT repeat protein
MPKETLASLDRDVERLLFAGPSVARTDGDLEAKKQKLSAFAAKVPAIGKVVEQIDKVQKASGKKAAVELYALAAQTAQIRGAQAPLAAAAGELAELPASEPVESPLTPTELSMLVKALTERGKSRQRIISDAVERGAVRDLRLLPYCVRALSDPAVGHVVADELLPKLGHLVVPELRATLRLEKGSETDAKKLVALTAILEDEAKPLLREAFAKGSPELRRTALQELSELDAAGVEPLALEALAKDRSAEVRQAAIGALGGATSDAALASLFEAFQGKDHRLRSTALWTLVKLAHPETTTRALALLTPELLALPNLKLPKATTPAQKKANEKAEREHTEKVSLLMEVLSLVAGRKDDRAAAEHVLAVFHEHRIKEVRNAAARALLRAGYDKALDELAPSIIEADWQTRDEFVEGILEHDAEHAFERLGRFLDPAALEGKNHVSFAEHILSTLEGASDDEPPAEGDEETIVDDDDEKPVVRPPSTLQRDPRWADAAIALLTHKALASSALDLLTKVKGPKAHEAVMTFVAAPPKGFGFWNILNAVKGRRDPRVGPILLKLLDSTPNTWYRRYVFTALRDHDDAAVLPALTAWGASKRKLENRDKEDLEATVQMLGRDRALG